MTFITYVSKRFNASSRVIIKQANELITDYSGQGYTLTLRQLYYQFVARDLLENTERSYKRLGKIVTDARMAGEMSWTGIEDRNRQGHFYLVEEDEREVLNGIERQFALDKWAQQDFYVEVWVEKEALANVLTRPCGRWAVPHMSCKGYLSASEAWRAGLRFKDAIQRGKTPVLIHLGDHDPSGIDMTRDNKDRLGLFAESWGGVEVRRIALNMDQIEQYSPPPNPTKLTDSRAEGYLREYGRTSWELDALEPSVIEKLVDSEIRTLVDMDVWREVKEEEAQTRERLAMLYEEWELVADYLDDLKEDR